MKRTRKILACVLGAALLLLSLGVLGHADTVSSVATKFLVLGDSIAAGSGVSDKQDAYAWIVAREKGWDLINYGAGGDGSMHMLAKVEGDEAYRQAVAGADVIAVSIGGNDLLHAEDFPLLVLNGLLGDYALMQPVLDAFRENFTGIVEGIRALNPTATLIVQTLYNPAFPVPALRTAYGTAIQGINASIRAYHAAHPRAFLLAEVHEAFGERNGLVYIDMTHPSAAGHAMIAAVLLNVLDAAQAPLPGPIFALDALVWALGPALRWLSDRLVEGVLRPYYWILAPVLRVVGMVL